MRVMDIDLPVPTLLYYMYVYNSKEYCTMRVQIVQWSAIINLARGSVALLVERNEIFI